MPPNEPYNTTPSAPVAAQSAEAIAPNVGAEHSVILTTGIIVVGLVVAAWLTLLLLTSTRNSQAQTTQTSIEEINNKLKDPAVTDTLEKYLALQQINDKIESIRDSRFVVKPAWDTIKANVPHDVQFTSVSLSTNRTMTITGISKSLQSVSEMAKAISSQPNFSNVTPLAVERPDVNNPYSFNMTMRAKPVSDKTEGP